MSEDTAELISAKPRIAINGTARADMEAAVLFMRVNLPFTGMAHAELRLLNWGTTDEGSEAGYAFQQIALGDRIQLAAGDSAEPALFEGEVTAIEEAYGQGAPRLVLLMEDKLHHLAKQRKSRVFDSVSVNDLVQTVISDASLTGTIQVSSDTGIWHQLNETNLGFLLRVLAHYDIPLRCSAGDVRAKADEEDAQPVEINTQSGISSLRIVADVNRQPLALKVNGFNLDADEAAQGQASDSGASEGKDAKTVLNELGWGSEDVMAYPFARNQGEANDWADAVFRRRASEFLHGELLISGNTQLRTGKQIQLTGASTRLNGKYRIVQAQHLFDVANGYKTRVKLTRSSWN